jgi:hypothetical protein
MLIPRFLATLALALEQRVERAQQHEHDAYLAQATDHADLEHRMRDLGRAPAWIPQYG